MMVDSDPCFCDLDDYADLVAQYEQAKSEHDEATAEVARLREMLVKLFPDEARAPDGVIVTIGGKARLSYRPQVRRQLDHHKLRDLYPSVAVTCTGYSTSWQLRIVRSEVTE